MQLQWSRILFVAGLPALSVWAYLATVGYPLLGSAAVLLATVVVFLEALRERRLMHRLHAARLVIRAEEWDRRFFLIRG